MTKRILIFCLLTITGLQAHGDSGLDTGTIVREDGVDFHWHLDRRGHDGPQGVLVLAQGSGCASPIQSAAIEKAAALAPESALVLLEKRGIEAGFKPDGDECPTSFHDHHTLSGWVSDLALVIASLRDAAWWNGELVLFGGSEGGAMATLAARHIPEADALIVLSSGLGMTMAETLLAVVPPEVATTLEHQFADIRANPDSSEVWSNHAYRWWHEVLDRNYIDDLLALEIPVMVIQGGRDRSVPVQSGRLVEQAFEQAGQSNQTYREYPELDHGMVDADGNAHLGRVIAEAAKWLEQVLDRREVGAQKRRTASARSEPANPQNWFDQRDYAALAAWLDGRDTSSTEVRYWKARLAQVKGQSGLALELAAVLTRVAPAYGAVAQAALFARQGDSSSELEALEKALVLDPMLGGARFRAGLVYAQHENWSQARRHFQELVDQIPLHMGAWYQLGRVAALSGQDLDTGRQALKRYLDADHRRGNPSEVAAHWRLGMIEQHAGQPENARKRYQQALDLDPEFEDARQSLAELNRQEKSS